MMAQLQFGSVQEYMEWDHARLDGLLAGAALQNFEGDAYTEFRRGLLRHISIEEKLLFPCLKSDPTLTSVLTLLRSHHGAIAALLIPRPTREIVAALKDVLATHNELEEGSRGVYYNLEMSQELLQQAIDSPSVPLSPAIDKLTDLAPVFRAMERAGFEPGKYFV